MPYEVLGWSSTNTTTTRELAFKVTGANNCTFAGKTLSGIDDTSMNSFQPKTKDNEPIKDLRAFLGDFSKGAVSGDVSFGVACGEWEKVEEWGHTNWDWTRDSIDDMNFQSEESAIFTWPRDYMDGFVVSVSHAFVDSATRLVLIDKEGEEHITGHNVIGEGKGIKRNVYIWWGISREDIASFRFETRPYEWVEFRNVSLKPGFKTDLEVEGESITSKLEFRVVPDAVESSRTPSPLTMEQEMRYRTSLIEKDFKGGSMGGDYIWLEADENLETSFLITEKYQGDTYVLVSNRPEEKILADGTWGLKRVYPSNDQGGRPAIGFEFDEQGSERFYKLTSKNVERALAIVIDGKVVSAPTVRAPIRRIGTIAGNFTQEQVGKLVESLQKGMPPISAENIMHAVQVEILTDKPAVALDLNAGKKIELKSQWPDEYEVSWDNDEGGVLFTKSKKTELWAITGVENFTDAIQKATAGNIQLVEGEGRFILASQSRFGLVKTSEGNTAVVEIVSFDETKASIRWQILEQTPAKQLSDGAETTGDSALVVQAGDLEGSSSGGGRVELSYDDGKSDGQKSIAGSGHGIIFDAPGDGYAVKTVRIFGSRYGQDRAPNEDFHIYVCDENLEVIKDVSFPYSRFTRGNPRWVTLRVKPVEVPSTFMICAGFNPERTKGVYIHYDNSSSGNSFKGLPGSEPEPFNEGEWMIRATLEKMNGDENDSERLQEPTSNVQKVSEVDKRASEELSSSGWKLWGERKLSEAEEQFKKAVEKDPTNANAWNGLGWSQSNQGKFENAVFSFEKCLEIEPEQAAALNGLGWIAKGKGNVEEAIGYWEKAVEALPSATAALNGLGQTYMELEQYDKAAEYYEMWLKVEPVNNNAKKGLEKAKSQIQPGIEQPAEGSSLQELIDSARAGYTVVVPEGTYTDPIVINKSLTLRGQSRAATIIQVIADMPAIMVDTGSKGRVSIENLTIKWQLATSDKHEHPYAISVKDTKAEIKNCAFYPLGNFQRSPGAVYASGFSNVTISGCSFKGFEYVISYASGTEGKVEDCVIRDCGHQGVMSYAGSTLRIERNVITGSKFHAVRTTGGTLFVKDNLIISNANRGIYLGNKSGKGTISNNVIMKNGTGVDGFASSSFKIENNVIGDNSFAGIGMRNSTSLTIRNNILMSNERGVVLFEPDGSSRNKIDKNTYWNNKVDAENVEKTPDSVDTEPGFTNPEEGDFSLKDGAIKEQKQGLTNPEIFKQLWKKWKGLEVIKTKAVSGIGKEYVSDYGSVPVVISTTPAAFAEDVSTDVQRIAVMFDQPMMDGSWSWTGGGETYPKTTGQIRYDRNKTTCILPVRLEPGKVYWVGINSPSHKNFKNANDVSAERYVILFSTKGADGTPTPIPEDMITRARAINEQSSGN
jgi:tetratricopeptide (TPR) repeat protein